jgi:hypothetical protein
MGIDTRFYDSVELCFDEADEDIDIDEEWEKFSQQVLVVDGEETMSCWDLVDNSLQASENFRGGPEFWAKWLVHIRQNFLEPRHIFCFDNPIPWRCVHTGGVCAGVLSVSDEIKLISVDEKGIISTKIYTNLFK